MIVINNKIIFNNLFLKIWIQWNCQKKKIIINNQQKKKVIFIINKILKILLKIKLYLIQFWIFLNNLNLISIKSIICNENYNFS